MSTHPQKKLGDWLNDHSTLTKIHKKICELTHLNELFLQQLETPLNQFCRVANYRDNDLIIQTESAAWATRLRYQIPALKIHLRHQYAFTKLRDIEIQVHPFISEIQSQPSFDSSYQASPPSSAEFTTPPNTCPQNASQNGKYSTRKRLQQPKLSAKSANLLKETANIISDKALSNALKRLAENER
jgi:hypothetical protein